MFLLQAVNFHIGLQGDAERLLRVISEFEKQKETSATSTGTPPASVPTPPSGGAVPKAPSAFPMGKKKMAPIPGGAAPTPVVVAPVPSSTPTALEPSYELKKEDKQFKFFASAYLGASHTFFEKFLVQLNVFGGYAIAPLWHKEFFNLPYFVGGELIAGLQFNKITLGFSGGGEMLWDRIAKIEFESGSPNTSLTFDTNKSYGQRLFGGVLFKHQIQERLSWFVKLHGTSTKDRKRELKSESNAYDTKYRYSGFRALIGVEFTM
ncbi:MAG: hypothetical protein H6850_01280 [Alphaproteobacteria bacterium]|nr:MAG: hypothetical protein H6850_01280 [Alphaproteobacteria bacterium]